jgi:hypothetical protein
MHLLTDLLSIFAASGITYAAAQLWRQNGSLGPRQRTVIMALAQGSAARALTADEDQIDLHQLDEDCNCGQDVFHLSFEINGRAVDPDGLEHALGKSVLTTIRRSIHRRVGALRCPTHGSAAKLLISGNSLGNLTWEARGCCPALVALIKKKLANIL